MSARTAVSLLETRGSFSGPTHPIVKFGRHLEQAATSSTADHAVFPLHVFRTLHHPNEVDLLSELISHNIEDLGLRTLLVLYADYQEPLRPKLPEAAIVIRSSLLSETVDPDEFTCPALIEEAELASLPAPTWAPTPRVGFTGQARPEGHHRLVQHPTRENAQVIGHTKIEGDEKEPFPAPINIGLVLRRQVLRQLEGAPGIETEFRLRERYHAFHEEAARRTMRREFIDNLVWSHYGLCIRGHGNYSIRLFEVMASGRVPIILDSAMQMPASDELDWNELGLWFSINQLPDLARKIREFHDSLGRDGYLELSHRVRQAWHSHLSLDSFRRYLARRLTSEESDWR